MWFVYLYINLNIQRKWILYSHQIPRTRVYVVNILKYRYHNAQISLEIVTELRHKYVMA